MNGRDFARAGNLFLPKHIIRGGRTPEIFVPLPAARFQGFFTVELIHARTGDVRQRLEFPNLITNVGLDGWYNTPAFNYWSYAAVGTGSNAPANTDTTLQAEIPTPTSNRTNANGGIADVIGYAAGPPEYVSLKKTYLFVEAQANGNLTEFGVFSASSAGTMWSRQLFKDGTGTPTVVVKTASDQLRITYEMRYYPPAGDTVTNPFTVSGVNYSVTTRPFGLGAGYQQSVGAFGRNTIGNANIAQAAQNTVLLTRLQGGFQLTNGVSCDTHTPSAYVGGSYYVDTTYVWNTGSANFGAGGIPLIANFGVNSTDLKFQNLFAPAIAKDNTKKLTLVFRESWGRYP